jgi:hypothetical protein
MSARGRARKPREDGLTYSELLEVARLAGIPREAIDRAFPELLPVRHPERMTLNNGSLTRGEPRPDASPGGSELPVMPKPSVFLRAGCVLVGLASLAFLFREPVGHAAAAVIFPP